MQVADRARSNHVMIRSGDMLNNGVRVQRSIMKSLCGYLHSVHVLDGKPNIKLEWPYTHVKHR